MVALLRTQPDARQWSNDDLLTAYRLRMRGRTWQQVADSIGARRDCVRAAVRLHFTDAARARMAYRERRIVTDARRSRIPRLIAGRDDMTLEELTTRLGCSNPETVANDVKALGLWPQFKAAMNRAHARIALANGLAAPRFQQERAASVAEGWPPVTARQRAWLAALWNLGGRSTLAVWSAALGCVPGRGGRSTHHTLMALGYVRPIRAGRCNLYVMQCERLAPCAR